MALSHQQSKSLSGLPTGNQIKIFWIGPCTIMALNLNHLFAIIVHEIGNSKQLHSRFADSCVVAEMQTRRRKNSELLHLRLLRQAKKHWRGEAHAHADRRRHRKPTPPSTVRCCAALLFCLRPPPRAGTVGRCFSRRMARRRPFANLREQRRRRRQVTGCCRRIRRHYISRRRDKVRGIAL